MRKILAIFAVCFLVISPLKLSFTEEQEQHFYIQLEPISVAQYAYYDGRDLYANLLVLKNI